MKRVLAILLCAFMAAGLLAACGPEGDETASGKNPGSSSKGGGNASAESGESSEPGEASGNQGSGGKSGSQSQAASSASSKSEPVKDNPLKENLGGAEIVIAVHDGNMFNKNPGKNSKHENAIAERTKKLEQELNCTIKMKIEKDVDKLQQSAFNSIMSGEKYADLVITPLHKLTAYMTSQMLVDLNTLPKLDLSKPYWKSSLSEISNIKGKTFYANCDANTNISAASVVLFNKRIAKELGYTGAGDPYALVKSNKWTISKMLEMMKKATREKDGKPGMTKDDQWGLSLLDIGTCGMTTYLIASGAQMMSGSKGNITYNMKSPKMIDTLNQAYDFYVKSNCSAPVAEGADFAKFFAAGNALFYLGSLGYISELSDMDDDFGLVPFPRGDDQPGFSSYLDWNAGVMMVPQKAQTDKIGAFMQALAYLSPSVAETYRKELSTRQLRDDTSTEMLGIVEKSMKTDYGQIFGAGAIWPIHEGVYQVIYRTSRGESPKTLIDTFEKTAVTSLNETLAAIK